MKRVATVCVLTGVLAVPAFAMADDPTSTDQQNAAKECKALRKAMGEENFRKAFGTNKNGKNAYGKCVSKKAREEAKENEQAKQNAAKQCKAEEAQLGEETFNKKYGTNKNGQNAYGKCVSQKAKQNKAEADQQDQNQVNAAKACRAEQKQNPDAFKQKYGTNKNKANAFGKCVSQKAKALNGGTS